MKAERLIQEIADMKDTVCEKHRALSCPICAKTAKLSNSAVMPGYTLADGEELNAGYFREIIDRTHIICSMIDDFLIEHPGMTVEMNKKCEEAQSLMCSVKNLAAHEEDKFLGV